MEIIGFTKFFYGLYYAMTCRHRWTVGESSDASHRLYSVQRSNVLQMKTRLDVFLPSNANEDVPNFQIIGSYHSQSFKVYRGQTLLAEVPNLIALDYVCFSFLFSQLLEIFIYVQLAGEWQLQTRKLSMERYWGLKLVTVRLVIVSYCSIFHFSVN